MELLTPKQVARAIGVSDASLKRWCDRGVLPSYRTAGGHRRIPLDGVIAWLRSSGRPLVRPELLGLPPTTGSGQTVTNRATRQIIDALAQGDEPQVQRLVVDLFLAQQPLRDICDIVLASAFEAIGDCWSRQEIEVYQERRAVEICQRTLHRLAGFLPPPKAYAPVAIGGTPESDPYALSTSMVELALREIGWRAESLGSNLPITTLIAAMRDIRPRLVWISASHLEDPNAFTAGYAELRIVATELGILVAIGGRALTERLRERMQCDIYCDNLNHLIAHLRDAGLDLTTDVTVTRTAHARSSVTTASSDS